MTSHSCKNSHITHISIQSIMNSDGNNFLRDFLLYQGIQDAIIGTNKVMIVPLHCNMLGISHTFAIDTNNMYGTFWKIRIRCFNAVTCF